MRALRRSRMRPINSPGLDSAATQLHLSSHVASPPPAARPRALRCASGEADSWLPDPSRTMEALSIPLPEEDGLSLAGREGEGDEVRMAAFTSWGSSTDGRWEETPTVRRRVSFADAFGLDLVSVKEYDDDDDDAAEDEREAPAQEEFFSLSCLFAAPPSEEELLRRLEGQMAELESVELLPGTTTLRGRVRVLNLCFSKYVYARITLDSWKSFFDLPADYVPGSSDRKTDRFTFQYTLVPPLEKAATRVEFCLRYETSVGTFWANNREMNYVIFCHRKSPAKQRVHEDPKRKRSCLRANRSGILFSRYSFFFPDILGICVLDLLRAYSGLKSKLVLPERLTAVM